MFRNGGGATPRTPGPTPPSAYRSGLQPVASGDLLADGRVVSRRASRTDLDFEQILLTEETVRIKEGPDISLLGVDSPVASRTPRNKNHHIQPQTPAVIPPTPASKPEPSDSESGQRRSIFRTSGTASSPDLATLARRAKEKARAEEFSKSVKATPSQLAISSDMLPANDSRSRPRSATASNRKFADSQVRLASTPVTPTSSKPSKDKGFNDWVNMSPTKDPSYIKMGKSSVRQRTTAFLGKLVGGGSMRDKKSNSLPPAPPPVPPVPDRYRQGHPTSESASSSEVYFSLPGSPELKGKADPVPEFTDSDNDSDDDLPPPVPTKIVKPSTQEESKVGVHSRTASASSARKRSISVGTIQDHRSTATPSLSFTTPPSPPPTASKSSDWNATVKGLMPDFKGLDPFTADASDESVPATPPKHSFNSSELPRDQSLTPVPHPDLSRRTSLQVRPEAPTVSMMHRAASLDVPLKSNGNQPLRPSSSRVASSPGPSPRGALRQSQRTLPSRPSFTNVFADDGPRPIPLTPPTPPTPPTARPSDSQRLTMHSRSPASASEPSLLGMLGETSKQRLREVGGSTVRLVPSGQQFPFPGTTMELSNLQISVSRAMPPVVPLTLEEIEQKGQESAEKCWLEDEHFLAKEKIAEWLGGTGPVKQAALHNYMQHFDFQGLRLDNAFRRLCAKLYLKAETQQVDRILDEFAKRYFDCNPDCIFGSSSVVHSVAYSLLLLNTDLHVAELSSHMSKAQFVRNTLQVLQESETSLPSSNRGSDYDSSAGLQRTKRSASITSWTSTGKDTGSVASPGLTQSSDSTRDTDSTIAPTPTSFQDSYKFSGTFDRNTDSDMETLLKDMYNAIKSQQILQPTASTSDKSLLGGSPHIARTGSRRGSSSDRLNTLKRGSIRGLQSLIVNNPHGPSPYSSNSSIDGRISPSPSFGTSTPDGYSASSSSFFTTPTYGFASNLSHTIIKESEEIDRQSMESTDSDTTNVSVTDAELALLGPPFAKEGSLYRKQYWEATNRRAKSKNWMEVFVVIQKGELDMFVFGGSNNGGAGVVGGGNWLSNATHVGTLSLAHSLAHSLPPPGYSRQRPHCFVLTLASGGVYFFQAGTEDLVNEWVATCNYWAARQSKEPLAGGVSNMEYGWNRVLPGNQDDDRVDAASTRSARSIFSKRSIAGSMIDRSSGSPLSDRVYINDWKPPMPPSIASALDEEAQLEAMEKQVVVLNQDLEAHQALQGPMMELYLPRSVNASKALQNWKNKSQFLTSEIVKYEIYVDALKGAMAVRHKRRGEKALEKALVEVNPEDTEEEPSESKQKQYARDAILETEEPISAGPTQTTFPKYNHESRSRTQSANYTPSS